MIENKFGVLLTNIGTPAQPSPSAVRYYLKKFLTDKRVVELPRWLWWPILYGFILPFRSRRSAKLYQSIWTNEGSPLLFYSQNIASKLEKQLQLPIALGMHYSAPSIADALTALKEKKVNRLLILPLYPQYSATTTASTFDAVSHVLKSWRVLPEVRMINHYANHPDYIQAIAESIHHARQMQEFNHLLFSFHGIPQKYIDAGDIYQKLCQQTTTLVANELQLAPNAWSIAFQSRLGRATWLTPYTQEVLTDFPQKGIDKLAIICPGFATDCLETLEEIQIRGKNQFLAAGGKSFHYIPALNDSDQHINVLKNIILPHLQGWL